MAEAKSIFDFYKSVVKSAGSLLLFTVLLSCVEIYQSRSIFDVTILSTANRLLRVISFVLSGAKQMD